jgi:hypothetical protein
VQRLVWTVGPDGRRIPGLESKTVPWREGYLTYVYNLTPDAMKVSQITQRLSEKSPLPLWERGQGVRAYAAEQPEYGRFRAWFILGPQIALTLTLG